MYGGASGFTINLLSSSAISRNRVSKNGVMFPPFSYVFFFFGIIRSYKEDDFISVSFCFWKKGNFFVEEKLVLCK